MRAFVAPSILLSIARCSRGFTQGLFPTTGGPSIRTSKSISSCNIMMAAVVEDATRWPLGIDPDNCKVVDIRQQIRRRYGAQRSARKQAVCSSGIYVHHTAVVYCTARHRTRPPRVQCAYVCYVHMEMKIPHTHTIHVPSWACKKAWECLRAVEGASFCPPSLPKKAENPNVRVVALAAILLGR